MMKTKLLSTIMATALVLFLSACSADDMAQGGQTVPTAPTEEITFEATPAVPTRTTMTNTGVFKWEAGDKIWVKDDTNTWRQSSNAPESETAAFKFKVPGSFTAGHSYTVFYPGKNGNQDKVTIADSQTQSEPNTPANIGETGDCGWGTATSSVGTKQFNFTLDHKATFLVFSPYCDNNPVLNGDGVKLTKVEVRSDNDLAGTFTIDPANAANPLTGAGNGKIINLTIGGGANPDGFPIPATRKPSANACYVLIKPGRHTLRVRFWIKSSTDNVEGTITKEYPAFTYAPNVYYTMESGFKVRDYSDWLYYQWDAMKPYWYGHEWNKHNYILGVDQPTVNGQIGSAYPKSYETATRYYNNSTLTGPREASHNRDVFGKVPNGNEMSWYVVKGDPRWDGEGLWTTLGHLYKAGIWFKKKARIAADNHMSVGQLRTQPAHFEGYLSHLKRAAGDIVSNPISPADKDDYFYLPALGNYEGPTVADSPGTPGKMGDVGVVGRYWSSTGDPGLAKFSYNLGFDHGLVYVGSITGDRGFIAKPFE